MFLFVCQMAEQMDDEDMKEVNRQVVRYLSKATKKNMNLMDSNGSTVLQLACESLSDMIIFETLVGGGADVNCVNNENCMPLKTIQERIQMEPSNDNLEEIEWFLQSRGAKVDWRQ